MRLLVPLLIAVLGQRHSCSAQEIAVRLIDASNGHVFANETMNLQFEDPQSPHYDPLAVKTGTDGVARFRLPESPPSKFRLWANGFCLCSDVFPVDTQLVIHEGLVPRCSKPKQGCRCRFGRQVSQLPPTPGEVVLLVRPITGWDKFWWRLSGKAN